MCQRATSIPTTDKYPSPTSLHSRRSESIGGALSLGAAPHRPLLGSLRSAAAAEGELADRAFDVEIDPRHFREQIDIAGADRASAQSHIGRHQIERLDQDTDISLDERIGD